MKVATGHVIPPGAITHVRSDIHIFNDSEHGVYVEVTDRNEVHVMKPIPYGRIIIGYTESEE